MCKFFVAGEVRFFCNVKFLRGDVMSFAKIVALLVLIGAPVGVKAGELLTVDGFEKMYSNQVKYKGKSNEHRKIYLYYLNGFIESSLVSDHIMFLETGIRFLCPPKTLENMTDDTGDETYNYIQQRKSNNKIPGTDFVGPYIFRALKKNYSCK